jgi:uncharacterized protein YbjT (DUF2867 family)
VRIFVTGASGFIGSAVARALARAGHEVHGQVRSEEKARALAAAEVADGAATYFAAWKAATGR